jgi:hypothetical protein
MVKRARAYAAWVIGRWRFVEGAGAKRRSFACTAQKDFPDPAKSLIVPLRKGARARGATE